METPQQRGDGCTLFPQPGSSGAHAHRGAPVRAHERLPRPAELSQQLRASRGAQHIAEHDRSAARLGRERPRNGGRARGPSGTSGASGGAKLAEIFG